LLLPHRRAIIYRECRAEFCLGTESYIGFMIYTFETYFGDGDRPRIAASPSWHNHKMSAHSHTFCELVYVLAGFSLHVCGSHSTLLTAGDMFLIPPGVEHTYVNAYRNGVLNFMFCPEDLADVLDTEDELPGIRELFTGDNPGEPVILHVDIAERRSVQNTFDAIRAERSARHPGWRTSLKMRMASLLVRYSRLYAAHLSENQTVGGGYSYVLRILSYVEKNYMGDISVEQLAQVAGLNPDYMSRRFKSMMGITPSDYVRKFRVAKAMELLSGTDMTVTAVASRCGFSDVCLFSRVFKNVTGVTPVQFRKSGILDLT